MIHDHSCKILYVKKANSFQPDVEVMKEYQEFNPFTELLFLEGHSDIVRLLLRIDGNRYPPHSPHHNSDGFLH